MFSLFASRLHAVRLKGLMAAVVFCFGLLMANPAVIHAQTSGDAGPVVGKVAPGQSAAVPEGTAESVLSYLANVIFPLLTVGFLAYVVFALKTGRGWLVGAVCAVCCLMLSGLTRLLEYHVMQGAAGIH
ncbi:MAG TPA: hypothetical protein VFB14_17695 [Bryobacteraceae bacterium]|jgi:hypothetical protein|nr:hypothetical protein [Bryobacteraceae bacterium]